MSDDEQHVNGKFKDCPCEGDIKALREELRDHRRIQEADMLTVKSSLQTVRALKADTQHLQLLPGMHAHVMAQGRTLTDTIARWGNNFFWLLLTTLVGFFALAIFVLSKDSKKEFHAGGERGIHITNGDSRPLGQESPAE